MPSRWLQPFGLKALNYDKGFIKSKNAELYFDIGKLGYPRIAMAIRQAQILTSTDINSPDKGRVINWMVSAG